MSERVLPAGYERLEPFVRQWAASTMQDRMERRMTATGAERAAFYEAAAPRLADALAHLDGRPLGSLPPEDTRLLNLMLALGHASLAIEIQGKGEETHAASRRRMVLQRTP